MPEVDINDLEIKFKPDNTLQTVKFSEEEIKKCLSRPESSLKKMN